MGCKKIKNCLISPLAVRHVPKQTENQKHRQK